ncbi:hypothetical protein [Halovivax sp.]|uniref:DUF7344 domain-containing protein n=1 Tax=Halovivax sp. TaxID=1935978 RepID=UPI0025BFFE44|nr:hypothetical protein [Halovivax sp.]
MNEQPSPAIPESRAYALLGHRRRRLILRILADFDDPLSTMELAELLADCECEAPTDRDRQSALLALSHNHLPKLDDAAVVDYDRQRGTIRSDSNFGVLVGMIDVGCEEFGPFAE